MKQHNWLQLFGEEEAQETAQQEEVPQAAEPEAIPEEPEETAEPDPREEAAARAVAAAERITADWMAQAEQLKQLYPDFDLRSELQDPRFRQLLRSRVDLQTAFEVIHNREIIPAMMQYAAQVVEQRLASSLRSGRDRPVENGIRSGGAVMLSSNAAHMSRQEYRDACRRVERGERISFG